VGGRGLPVRCPSRHAQASAQRHPHPRRAIQQDRPQDRYLATQARTGRSGVAAIGIAQEYASVFTGTRRPTANGAPSFSFAKVDRA